VRARAGSLRLRLLGATLATLVVALVGAHWWLTGLFRDHVLRQFDITCRSSWTSSRRVWSSMPRAFPSSVREG
jgi:hypothetical protein